jgi:hypothetical protein
MGAYIYVRKSGAKHTIELDNHIKINILEYATKPYWGLWTQFRALKYHSAQDRALISSYNALRGRANRAIDSLTASGKLSDFIVLGLPIGETDKVPVKRDPYACGWICDLDFDGMETVGYLIQEQGKLRFVHET